MTRLLLTSLPCFSEGVETIVLRNHNLICASPNMSIRFILPSGFSAFDL